MVLYVYITNNVCIHKCVQIKLEAALQPSGVVSYKLVHLKEKDVTQKDSISTKFNRFVKSISKQDTLPGSPALEDDEGLNVKHMLMSYMMYTS